MYPVSWANTHHDIKDLVNHGMTENTKSLISSEEPNLTFLTNKKILNMCLKWHTLRCYNFAVTATFKPRKNLAKIGEMGITVNKISFNISDIAM